eukprot:CAMPEP_0198426502 /NCGR_PEP_ID=MMETSP1452-20131203/5289_1 /TAXON_ID=1181717 /ORGANISM="Synchroma pusillum, Strain CCMP3072" /LENGTH=228 /DNA_ID=CAMNT_0044146875 /DNA_START=49 /DNA_END=735 /DNA_ORIENTATION=-
MAPEVPASTPVQASMVRQKPPRRSKSLLRQSERGSIATLWCLIGALSMAALVFGTTAAWALHLMRTGVYVPAYYPPPPPPAPEVEAFPAVPVDAPPELALVHDALDGGDEAVAEMEAVLELAASAGPLDDSFVLVCSECSDAEINDLLLQDIEMQRLASRGARNTIIVDCAEDVLVAPEQVLCGALEVPMLGRRRKLRGTARPAVLHAVNVRSGKASSIKTSHATLLG